MLRQEAQPLLSGFELASVAGDVVDDMDDSLGDDAGIDLQKRDRAKGGTDVGEPLKAFFATGTES